MHLNPDVPIPLSDEQKHEQETEVTDPSVLKRHLADYQRKVIYFAQRMKKYEDIMRRDSHKKLSLEKQTRAVRRLTSASMEHSQNQRIVEAIITKLNSLT